MNTPGLTVLLTAFVALPSATLAQVAPVAREAGEGAMPELFSAGYLVQVLGSLAVVFVCLFAVILLLRRMNRVGSVAGPLRVIGSASVGAREKIVLVAAGEQQLLIGVAPGAVRTLHVLEEPLVLDRAENQGLDFAAVLRAASPLGGRS